MEGKYLKPKLCVTAVSGQLVSLWTYNQTVHCVSMSQTLIICGETILAIYSVCVVLANIVSP